MRLFAIFTLCILVLTGCETTKDSANYADKLKVAEELIVQFGLGEAQQAMVGQVIGGELTRFLDAMPQLNDEARKIVMSSLKELINEHSLQYFREKSAKIYAENLDLDVLEYMNAFMKTDLGDKHLKIVNASYALLAKDQPLSENKAEFLKRLQERARDIIRTEFSFNEKYDYIEFSKTEAAQKFAQVASDFDVEWKKIDHSIFEAAMAYELLNLIEPQYLELGLQEDYEHLKKLILGELKPDSQV